LENVSINSTDVLRRAISCFEPDARRFHIVRRNGHPHLAMPPNGGAMLRTLALYHPQRPAGKLLTGTLRVMARAGLQWVVTPLTNLPDGAPELLEPPLPEIEPGSCGIMLGSPEHRIRRAIASYRTASGWEVAKVASGSEGAEMLVREAATLTEFSVCTPAAPPCLGLHCGRDITILRMPRIEGTPIAAGESDAALALLHSWISRVPSRPATTFPEWKIIVDVLADFPGGPVILERISNLQLTPALRHGDFARWNLLAQPDGSLIALDWEWGGTDGMPGLDLVHYFLQDARLVSRSPPPEAIVTALECLRCPVAAAYLTKTGWKGDSMLPIIASLAYKQGAKQQDNEDILNAAVKHKSET
jgi:hypothetical protein